MPGSKPYNERKISEEAFRIAFTPEKAAQFAAQTRKMLKAKKFPSAETQILIHHLFAYWLPLPKEDIPDKNSWRTIHQLQGKNILMGTHRTIGAIRRMLEEFPDALELPAGDMPTYLIRPQELKER